MTDPMDSLRGLQSALDARTVQLQQFRACKLHPELRVMLDLPAPGVTRFTYALLDAKPGKASVRAIVVFVVTEPIDGTPCFQTGYAVVEAERRKGIASRILEHAVDELRDGMSSTPVDEFYIEPVVGADNEPSKKIASRVLSIEPESRVGHRLRCSSSMRSLCKSPRAPPSGRLPIAARRRCEPLHMHAPRRPDRLRRVTANYSRQEAGDRGFLGSGRLSSSRSTL